MVRSFGELTAAGRARRLRPLVEAALRHWDVDVRRIRLLTNDFNGVFRIDTATGPRVLRVSLPLRTDAELRAELAWLDALQGVVDVPRWVPTRAGRPWAIEGAPGVPGMRRCVLFTWVPGRAMRVDDRAERFASLGAVAAALHAQAATWRRPRGLLIWDRSFPHPEEPPILFDLALPRDQLALWRDAEQAADEGFATLARTPERPRIAHMDISPGNAKVSRGRIAILDFDDCMLAHPVQDLGMSAFHCRSRGVSASSLRAFRAGYERIAAWPDDPLLQRFVAAAALELANAVYQDFDPGYRAQADRLATKWSRIARAALRRI
jgi:Ser/Thr protein kinase RdoA (MazF antagonist)